MKNYILFCFLLYSLNVFSQNETAQQYYDFIEQHEITVGSEIVTLSKILKNADAKELLEQMTVLRSSINNTIERIDDTDAFAKSKYLKQAALDYFEALKHLAKSELKVMIDILAKENVTAEDKEKAQGYYSKIKDHIEDADKELKESKQKFAEKHQLKVQQNPFKFYLEETKH